MKGLRLHPSQIVGLGVLTLMLIAVELFVHLVDQPHRLIEASGEDSLAIASLSATREPHYRRDTVVIRLRPFDPNQEDSAQLVSLGLKPWQARAMVRYREKGGRYRRPEDLKRLWGMTDSLYATLEPYIQIATRPSDTLNTHLRDTMPARDTLLRIRKVDTLLCLNTTDTLELQLLRGVGSYTARRIVRYREELGGYVATEQLREIEGLRQEALDTILTHLLICSDSVNRLPVNYASIKRLTRHPYLSFTQAKALYEHRRRHVYLRDIEALRSLSEFTSDDIERLRPYLSFERRSQVADDPH